MSVEKRGVSISCCMLIYTSRVCICLVTFETRSTFRACQSPEGVLRSAASTIKFAVSIIWRHHWTTLEEPEGVSPDNSIYSTPGR